MRRRFGAQNRAIAKAHSALEDKVRELEKCNDDLLKENYQLRCENMRLQKGQVNYKDDILSKIREVEKLLTMDDNDEGNNSNSSTELYKPNGNTATRPLDTITRRKPRGIERNYGEAPSMGVDECDTAMLDTDSTMEYSSQVIHDVIAELDEEEGEGEDALVQEHVLHVDQQMDQSVINDGEGDNEVLAGLEEAENVPTEKNEPAEVIGVDSLTPDEEAEPEIVVPANDPGESAQQIQVIPEMRGKRTSSQSPRKPAKRPRTALGDKGSNSTNIKNSPQKKPTTVESPEPPRRRSRGNQVNYALPSLRTKMRREKDGFVSAISENHDDGDDIEISNKSDSKPQPRKSSSSSSTKKKRASLKTM